MRYILIDEKRRSNCIDEISKIDITKPIEVTIKRYKKNRTNSQNNLYHMWKEPISLASGYSEKELHEILKLNFLGADLYLYKGDYYLKPISTSEQSIPDMANFLRKVEAVGNFLEAPLRRPDDYMLAIYGK